MKLVNRAQIDTRYREAVQLITRKTSMLNTLKTDTATYLKLSINPQQYEQEFKRTLPDLVVLKAYNDAERTYTRTNADFLGYVAYMDA